MDSQTISIPSSLARIRLCFGEQEEEWTYDFVELAIVMRGLLEEACEANPSERTLTKFADALRERGMPFASVGAASTLWALVCEQAERYSQQVEAATEQAVEAVSHEVE